MSSKLKTSEAAYLERCRVAFENAKNQPVIAQVLNEFGYPPDKMAEGKSLYDGARAVYDRNKREDDETTLAYSLFKAKYEEIDEFYSIHRRKAKVVFKDNLPMLERLGLTGSMPNAYIKCVEVIRKFYYEVENEPTILQALGRLKITADEISRVASLIGVLESLRADYLREKGESQEATQKKDAAFSVLDDWMSEFYAVAKIALEDHPQLAEVLGKTVR